MAKPTDVAAPQVFVRKASGLVRTAGPLDVLFYNLSYVGVGPLIVFVVLFGPAFYPGMNMELTVVLGSLVCLPLALVFGYLASTMPRSGGDYVYVSRVLGPAWGMMSNFNTTFWLSFYGGIPSAFLARYGLSPLFRTLGAFTGNTTLSDAGNWFATPLGMFLMGAVLIVGLLYIFQRGMRTFLRNENVLSLASLGALLVTALVLVFNSPADFAVAFDKYVGPLAGNPNLYDAVLKAGREAGFVTAPFSFGATMLAATWVFFSVPFMQASAFIGSEVKDARRLQLWAIPTTLISVALASLVVVWATHKAVGYEFLGAVSWVDPASLGMSSTPLVAEFASYLSHNIVLALIITAGFAYWSCSFLPGQIINGSRNILAYAIDGLFPAWFKKVDAKRHTPVNALLTMGIASLIALALYVFTPWFTALTGIFGYILSFVLVSIAAAILPYRLPDVFETSTVNQRLGRVPVISLIGVLSAAGCILMLYLLVKDPMSGLTPTMIGFNVGVLVLGLVIYYVAKWAQGRRGVDVSLSYKQIPEE